MCNAITPETRYLWLMLRNDSGWWSVFQLTQFWRPTFSTDEMRNHLEVLHKHGFVERRRATNAAHVRTPGWDYAVTPQCTPLPGYQSVPTPV